jgi:hypothetical protein
VETVRLSFTGPSCKYLGGGKLHPPPWTVWFQALPTDPSEGTAGKRRSANNLLTDWK